MGRWEREVTVLGSHRVSYKRAVGCLLRDCTGSVRLNPDQVPLF
jgi:hypothetical protein